MLFRFFTIISSAPLGSYDNWLEENNLNPYEAGFNPNPNQSPYFGSNSNYDNGNNLQQKMYIPGKTYKFKSFLLNHDLRYNI